MELGDTLIALHDFVQYIGPANLMALIGVMILCNIMLMVEW